LSSSTTRHSTSIISAMTSGPAGQKQLFRGDQQVHPLLHHQVGLHVSLGAIQPENNPLQPNSLPYFQILNVSNVNVHQITLKRSNKPSMSINNIATKHINDSLHAEPFKYIKRHSKTKQCIMNNFKMEQSCAIRRKSLCLYSQSQTTIFSTSKARQLLNQILSISKTTSRLDATSQ
jgi:hypothetical protein